MPFAIMYSWPKGKSDSRFLFCGRANTRNSCRHHSRGSVLFFVGSLSLRYHGWHYSVWSARLSICHVKEELDWIRLKWAVYRISQWTGSDSTTVHCLSLPFLIDCSRLFSPMKRNIEPKHVFLFLHFSPWYSLRSRDEWSISNTHPIFELLRRTTNLRLPLCISDY